jgi:cation:H+ antiporter
MPDTLALSDALLGVVFVLGAALSLAASYLLVTRLEQLGARLALTEGLLGLLAALAADTPEITAAASAVAQQHHRIGAGVVLGSNVFNLAALLGLAAIVAGRIGLHRRVIELGGAVAVWICAASLAVVTGACPPPWGLVAVLAVLVPYVVMMGVRRERLRRLPLPAAWTRWLVVAIHEEELELEVAIHPRRGHLRDGALAALALAVVLGASIAMERTAAKLGSRHAVPEILIGALVLAAVTSLPNAVAAVYLAARGRGAATLSIALNSNALNVLFGLLIVTTIAGLGPVTDSTTFVAASYAGLTLFALAWAYRDWGLHRGTGLAIIAAYVAFVAVLVAGTA